MKTVYAIICSANRSFDFDKFYFSKESARKRLAAMAEDRKYNTGVHCFKQEEDKFSFRLGWEEAYVEFSITSFEVEE